MKTPLNPETPAPLEGASKTPLSAAENGAPRRSISDGRDQQTGEGASSPVAGVSDEDIRAVIASHGGELPTGLLAVSYSRLSRYQRCGEAYKLQFVTKVDVEPNGAAVAGQVCHELIQEMIVDGWFVDPELVDRHGGMAFVNRFTERILEVGGVPYYDPPLVMRDGRPDNIPAGIEGVHWGGRKRALRDDNDKIVKDADGNTIKVGEDYRWFLKMGPVFLKRAGTILRDDVKAGRVIVDANVERRVSAWLDGPGSTLITGIIDAMVLEDEEGTVIRDWKTGSFSEPMQLGNYAWLVSNLENPEERLDVTHGEIAYLRGTTKDTWLRRYDVRPWIPLIPRMFRDMLAGIDAGVYQLVPSSFCGSCWVRASCEYGKTLP